MFRLSLKSILAKKLRLLSTALAVILGVAFLAGTLVFTDTIQRSFDDLFADVFEDTDAYVRSSSTTDLGFGNVARGRIPESMIAEVASVPGVSKAYGHVDGYAQLVGTDGKAIGNPGRGAPTLGMTYTPSDQDPWTFGEGSRAPGPGEVAIDKGSADLGGLAVGDTVTVLTQTGPHELPLVGVARFGTVDSPGGASVALFDLTTAQELLLGGAGELNAVVVEADADVSSEAITDRIAQTLPEGTEVLTGAELTREAQDTIRDAFGFFNTFLMVFAVIGLVVACFTIYNTFQIVITQRTREMALLRALGATSRQVLGGQILEAALLGVFASLSGLGVGVFVATGLKQMMAAFGIEVPGGGTVVSTRTVVAALVVGTAVTMFSAVFPALRASRIPPIAAIRDLAIDRAGQSRRSLIAGAVLTTLGTAAFVVGLSSAVLIWVGVGALLVFVGIFVLGPLIARPATRVLGAPLARFGRATGPLARENAMRNPKRTARTGGALMVGVALVVGITVIAASAKDWVRDVFGNQFNGDFVVSTDTTGFGGLPTGVAAALNQLPEVDAAAGVRIGTAVVVDTGEDTVYSVVDPALADRVFDIGMIQGSVAGLTDSGILIEDGQASRRHLSVGDTITFGFLNGQLQDLTIEGIYTKDDLAGPFVVSQTLHERTGVDQFDFSVFITKAPGVDDAAARAAIETVSGAYPNAKLESRAEYIDAQAGLIDQLVNLMYGLLGLAVIIALFSIANSMVLSIHERTRELGLLRAVGMTRQQTRNIVSWEAVLVALLGSLLGLAIGLFFGWSISVTMRDEGLAAFVVPIPALVVVTVLAVLGAVLASLRPAWRASRLDVLGAIAAE
jgi:putative ABC transport system permease protein